MLVTMSAAELVVYIVAVSIGLLLYWLFRPADQEMGKPDTVDAEDDGIVTVRYKPQPSMLSMLGLKDHNQSHFSMFEDHFKSFRELSRACMRAGLESCQLIIGVDFTASNEWQGRKTFHGQNLHKIVTGKVVNPYQKVISILGETLEPFDSDGFIPAYGFGDSTTMGQSVFSFCPKGSEGCKGFKDVLDKYNQIVPQVSLSGPTNFAPLIRRAIEVVKLRKRYHILIIIADGQVNEEMPTIDAIVEASSYPLSIVVVGVGDGPWDTMEEFDNELPKRKFDNFQFVNYHGVTAKSKNPDTAFALHTLMEIPDQYKTIKALGYIEEEVLMIEKIQKLKHTFIS